MCYFIGIRTTIDLEKSDLFLGNSYVLVENVTNRQKLRPKYKYYYEVTRGGCSCECVSPKFKEVINEIKMFIDSLPGEQRTQVMFFVAGNKQIPYEIRENYEAIKEHLKSHTMYKHEFLELYPDLEEDTVYILE